MKQWKIGIVGAILAVALLSTTALAAGHGHGRHTAHLHESCSWSESCARDTDGDGFCDTCGRTVSSHRDASCAGLCAACSAGCADRDGDLVCDSCGQAVHTYVDADGDGSVTTMGQATTSAITADTIPASLSATTAGVVSAAVRASVWSIGAASVTKRGCETGMRSEEETNRAIERYADTVRRICMVHLKNGSDTEDIFQTVFLKYVLRSAPFDSDEHEKAWFIRVTINACKDLLKSFFRTRVVPLEDWTGGMSPPPDDDAREVLDAVLSLPPKYKDVVYLHYYEGYTAGEIGRILGKNVNTVYTLLTRAKERLRTTLEGGRDHD